MSEIPLFRRPFALRPHPFPTCVFFLVFTLAKTREFHSLPDLNQALSAHVELTLQGLEPPKLGYRVVKAAQSSRIQDIATSWGRIGNHKSA